MQHFCLSGFAPALNTDTNCIENVLVTLFPSVDGNGFECQIVSPAGDTFVANGKLNKLSRGITTADLAQFVNTVIKNHENYFAHLNICANIQGGPDKGYSAKCYCDLCQNLLASIDKANVDTIRQKAGWIQYSKIEHADELDLQLVRSIQQDQENSIAQRLLQSTKLQLIHHHPIPIYYKAQAMHQLHQSIYLLRMSEQFRVLETLVREKDQHIIQLSELCTESMKHWEDEIKIRDANEILNLEKFRLLVNSKKTRIAELSKKSHLPDSTTLQRTNTTGTSPSLQNRLREAEGSHLSPVELEPSPQPNLANTEVLTFQNGPVAVQQVECGEKSDPPLEIVDSDGIFSDDEEIGTFRKNRRK